MLNSIMLASAAKSHVIPKHHKGSCASVQTGLALVQVQGSDRTKIKAAKPNASEENDNDPSSSWDLVAEHSFAREFYNIVMNAGWSPYSILMVVLQATVSSAVLYGSSAHQHDLLLFMLRVLSTPFQPFSCQKVRST